LLTDLTSTEVASLKADVDAGRKHPRDAKSELAKKIVADFHSQADADNAESEFIRRFREHQIPVDVATFTAEVSKQKVRLADLLVDAGLAASKAEARRLIEGGGIKVNQERVNDTACEIDTDAQPEVMLQRGKLQHTQVVFKRIA
jgi:tyrosyl-tRNA synthetase